MGNEAQQVIRASYWHDAFYIVEERERIKRPTHGMDSMLGGGGLLDCLERGGRREGEPRAERKESVSETPSTVPSELLALTQLDRADNGVGAVQ